MSLSSSISRFAVYLERNGFKATVRRARLAAKRALFSNRMVLFYCDLSAQSLSSAGLPASLKVERKRSETELSPQDLRRMTSFWNPELARRNIEERFRQGASLWMIKSEGNLVGFGWTLRGRTVEPHYFRLGQNDVHLFDFHVFSEYRGHGLNPLLVTDILRNLAVESEGRAFIETAEWNQAQLSSLRKTSFHRLGSARKCTILGHTFVLWARNEIMAQGHRVEASYLTAADRTSGSSELKRQGL